MPSRNIATVLPQSLATTRQHFDVRNELPKNQLLAWRDKIGGVMDLLPSLIQIGQPFNAWVNHYQFDNDIAFADLYADAVRVERSLARISTDRQAVCNQFYFSVCLDGDSHQMEGRYATRSMPFRTKILALDMAQPIRMQAHQHRMSAFFVPRALIESFLPDADSLHGRAIDDTTPIARLLIAHATTLNEQVASMSNEEASAALLIIIELLVAAFGKNARLSGSSLAAARAAMFGQARAYIKENLYEADLSAETVLKALKLPRHKLYRMFEHEGGIASYIYNCRLRAAAEDISRFPNIELKNIAYGLGFNSASAFSRSFRREFGIAPKDLREHLAQHRKQV